MSVRLARSILASATRRAQCTAISRRNMSSTSHGDDSTANKSNDTPWIIGSLMIFGPAFLYLLSPSARKSNHIHNDKHDYPGFTEKKAQHDLHEKPSAEESAPPPPPTEEVMTDDEGTVADVGASIALAEGSDVPNDSQSPEEQAKILAEAESSSAPASESNTVSDSETEESVTSPEPDEKK